MKSVLVVAGVLVRDGRLLMAQRPLHGPRGGLWEMPGGKVEPDESPEMALVREWREELGVLVASVSPFTFTTGDEEGRHVTLLFFRVGAMRGTPRAAPGSALRWCSAPELRLLAMPPLDVPATERLLAQGLPDTWAADADEQLRRAAEEEAYVEGSESLAVGHVVPFVKRGILGASRLEGILVSVAAGVFAYENLCPHVPIPLDRGEGEFLSIDGSYLACRSHGALFEPETGLCVSGPCQGESLRALPLERVGAGYCLGGREGGRGVP